MLIFLGILLIALIFTQRSCQETLCDVFDTAHVSTVEKTLVVLTYIDVFAMMILIYKGV